MNRLRNFMYGRYGVDRLSQVLLGATCILTLAGTLVHSTVLVTLSYLPLIYSIYRTLSKDIYKRADENRKFEGIWQKVTSRWKASRTHRFYKCPSCKQNIRVPKGKGKIAISCPKCKTEFIKRT